MKLARRTNELAPVAQLDVRLLVEFCRALIHNHPSGDVISLSLGLLLGIWPSPQRWVVCPHEDHLYHRTGRRG